MRTLRRSDMGYVDELTKEFLAESMEGLDRMDRCLTELEQRPGDKALLGEIFRAVHTIKGTTGFLGFSRLEKLAHAGESLLGSLRDGVLVADAGVVGGLLELMDGLRAILRLIERTGKEGTRASDEDSALIARMQALNQASGHAGEVPATSLSTAQAVAELPPPPEPVLPERRSETAPLAAAANGVSSDRTLRVDVEVLNRMMNLVGELVLTRNQIVQSGRDAAHFAELARRLNTVTADLRETVMHARMQPVGHLFGKFPRLVRDLALSCGKLVRIEFSGQETGLDKSLLEAIKDPLTHAVRNAVDHGIEDPAMRVAAGKPPEGVVHLRAHQQNGFVVIEVEDDGAGISQRRVLARAVERSLITEEEAAGLSEREVLQLIFHPGFSTADKVTHISGRGVGMDVVLANVENAGGLVELESHEGTGTLLRLRVPLTLAIMRALIVRAGGQSFCLPQSALAELVCVPLREAAESIAWIGDSELFRLRDRLVPIVRLDRILGMDDENAAERDSGFYVVLLESEGRRYGLLVDDLLTPEEIVVKPLSPVLREIGMFSGATVLGNGSLAMILDLAAIHQHAGVRPGTQTSEAAPVAPPASHAAEAKTSFLLFEDFRHGERPDRRALPLTEVERIETVAVERIEFAGSAALLQYRGEPLLLQDRGDLIEELLQAGPDAMATVLICQRPGAGDCCTGSRKGIVVRAVLEVAEGSFLPSQENTAGQLAMIDERLTVVHEAFLREIAVHETFSHRAAPHEITSRELNTHQQHWRDVA